MRKIKYVWIRIKRRVLGLKPGEMYADFGKGRFVDVTKTLDGRIFIRSHTKYPFAPEGTIIVIPYQPNHGVMVEFVNESGKSEWRSHMNYQDFYTKFATSSKEATLNNQTTKGDEQ